MTQHHRLASSNAHLSTPQPASPSDSHPPCSDRRRFALAALVGATTAALASIVSPAARAADGAPGAEAVALVKRVDGTVRVYRGGQEQPLMTGQSLLATDRLVTSADSAAALVFRDGTQLTVGASTDLHLRRYAFEPKADDYAFDIYLAKGRAVYASGKIGKLSPQSVRLDTPTATVGVRGTRLILEAE